MEFIIEKIFDYEMVHYASDDLVITSKGNKVFYNSKIIVIPENISFLKKIARYNRKTRRLCRLDKMLVYPSGANLVIVRGGIVFHYDLNTDKLIKVLSINCRNPMYYGLAETEDKILLLSEYGNKNEHGKRIFKSTDGGRTWVCAYTFGKDDIRHIHCVSWDPYEKKIWIFTGDSNGECKVGFTDISFSKVNFIGDGGQKYRACQALFSKDYVDWIMDSPLETVKHIRYVRSKEQIIEGQSFAGPVWFAKQLENGIVIAASAQEIGPSHSDKNLHLYATEDLNEWRDVRVFSHDGWPKGYFRYGTICFARGNLSNNKFYIFCEGVKGLDGKSALCSLGD